jgi:CHAT domain-containing protein/tetratricopeptide (TPR) repeat protein
MNDEPQEARRAALITGFFAALARREFDRCVALLTAFRALPAPGHWPVYFEALLANERDRDYGHAARLLNQLIDAGLEPDLAGRVPLALGRSYDYQGRWNDAIAAYERALPIFEAAGSAVDQAKIWKQIAIAYRNGFAQGDFGAEVLELAEAYCRRALAALGPEEQAPPDVAWLIGSVWNTIGLVMMNRGRWDEAGAAYRRDLAIAEAQGDRHGAAISRLNLGEIAHGLGRWEEAGAAYAEALAVMRAFGDPFQEADVLANQAVLLQETGADAEALACFAEAIALIESLRAGVASEEARAAFFATTADTYANAVLHCVKVGLPALALSYVERARSRAFLDTLAAGSAELPAHVEAAPLDATAIQAALPPDALVLEYFTTGLTETQAVLTSSRARRHRFPPPRTLLFAVTHARIQVFELGIAPNALLPAALDNVAERHFLDARVRRRLYAALLAPAAPAMAAARRVYVIPHGPLHYIPFQSLLAPDGETVLRDGGCELIFGLSATIVFQHRAPRAEENLLPLLAAGANGAGPRRLHFAEDEARAVAALSGGDTLLGDDLTRESLFARAPHYRIVHLSCHGMFDAARPLESALALGRGEHLSARQVLGALRLNADLVALSACESGLSRVRRGDELAGLVRAFRAAGARAVLCTLWRVDERSTRILMEMFYQRVQTGQPYATALHNALLALRRLTRREAREWLVARFAADVVAGAVKHLARPEPDTPSLLTGDDNACPFAEPFFWAPFVLIESTIW